MQLSLTALIGTEAESRDYAPLLRWLLVNCLALVGFVALWRFGLDQAVRRASPEARAGRTRK